MSLTRKPSSLTPVSLESSPSSGTFAVSTSPSSFSPHSLHGPRASMSTVDSGYAGSLYRDPMPERHLSRTYEHWKIADAASARLFVDFRAAEECKSLLYRARKLEKQQAASQSPNMSRKTSFLHIPGLGGRRKQKPEDLHISTSPPAPSGLIGLPADQLPSVEDLEARLKVLENRIASIQDAARQLDELFEELRKHLDDGRPVSWRSSTSSNGHRNSPVDEYTRCRKAVGTRDQAYLDSKATTDALKRARTAVQSAHHHYSEATQLLDAVCSPKKGRWEAVLGDEQSRQQTYREATEWANKAQLCFNECVKALLPHWDLLKQEELSTCEDLKETGLLQAVQLYKLMYGGKVLAMGITQQVQTMMQKQDAVYERLTNFAVWVQDCTKVCETVELDAHESRDAARRALVALWVRADEACERYNLAAPSENSHVFHMDGGSPSSSP